MLGSLVVSAGRRYAASAPRRRVSSEISAIWTQAYELRADCS